MYDENYEYHRRQTKRTSLIDVTATYFLHIYHLQPATHLALCILPHVHFAARRMESHVARHWCLHPLNQIS